MRLPDWEQRLHDATLEAMTKPHAFGSWDCLVGFTAEAVKAVTGKDHGKGHRGKYKSQATAYRYLKSLGFDSPEAYLDSLFPQKPVGFAGRGDLVLVGTETGDNPGAVVTADVAMVVGQIEEHEGLIAVKRPLWIKAWAVGDHHSGEMGL